MPNQIKTISPAEGNPFIPLRDPTGISVAHDPRTNTYELILEAEVPYPEKGSSDDPLALMLLRKSQDVTPRTYLLPDNFITMGQVLNDAIGMRRSRRGMEVGRQVFGEVGKGLASIAMYQNLFPKHISYKNILFSRDSQGALLLPPIEFLDAEGAVEDERNRVVEQLRDSCEAGAANYPQQQYLPEVFISFEKAYNW